MCVCVSVCVRRLDLRLTLCDPMDCSQPSFSVHGVLQKKKNTGVGVCCHFLLQGIFLTQWWNPGLLHCRQILYHLSYREYMCHFLKKKNQALWGLLLKYSYSLWTFQVKISWAASWECTLDTTLDIGKAFCRETARNLPIWSTIAYCDFESEQTVWRPAIVEPKETC